MKGDNVWCDITTLIELATRVNVFCAWMCSQCVSVVPVMGTAVGTVSLLHLYIWVNAQKTLHLVVMLQHAVMMEIVRLIKNAVT